jgi:hypothetical protein
MASDIYWSPSVFCGIVSSRGTAVEPVANAPQRAQQQGQVAEQQQRFKSSQVMAAQRAALASQGGDINSGSPLDIGGDTARAGEFDAQTIRNNAAMQAYGFRVQAANAGAQSNLHSASAANTMAALPFGLGSTLLGGAKSMLTGWPSMSDSPVSNYIPGTKITYADGVAGGIMPL